MPLDPQDRLAIAALAIDLAWRAGDAIMAHYAQGAATEWKEDKTPVTIADREADAIIVAGLRRESDIPVISEESVAAAPRIDVDRPFFLVDPLDGTKQFIGGIPEFTVNIALIEHREPTLGVVLAPARKTVYWTAGNGKAWRMTRGAGREPIACRIPPTPYRNVVTSRSHLDQETLAYLDGVPVSEKFPIGSALKFCLVAEGTADLYPRFGPTMEWDTSAGHALVLAAGGTVTAFDGGPFRYGKPGFLNPGFIAKGRAA